VRVGTGGFGAARVARPRTEKGGAMAQMLSEGERGRESARGRERETERQIDTHTVRQAEREGETKRKKGRRDRIALNPRFLQTRSTVSERLRTVETQAVVTHSVTATIAHPSLHPSLHPHAENPPPPLPSGQPQGPCHEPPAGSFAQVDDTL